RGGPRGGGPARRRGRHRPRHRGGPRVSGAAGAVMLSAGETSGDLHGGTLCRALRDLEPGVGLVGMGGPRMAAAGMEGGADPTAHAVVGTSEAVGRLPGLYRAYRALVRRLREAPPRALVVIDVPEFNMRLARPAPPAGA